MILLLGTIILILALTISYKDYAKVQEELILDFDIKVAEEGAGFNLDEDKLHFGSVCKGCYAKRKIFLNNSHRFDEKVRILVSSQQPIHKWISVKFGDEFILPSGETKEVFIYAQPSKEAEKGTYSGKIIIQTFKAKPWD